jgi:4-hydroxy 2-oxovalerate aldolase
VDSFGACFPDQVKAAVAKAKKSVNVPLGFHGHNNVELAFANALAAIEAGVGYLDSTITGMGRGAGNLKTEIIVSYLESRGQGGTSDLSSLGALIEDFDCMRKHFGWGSNLPYVISGLNSLPQKDVMDWLSKDRYSTSAIVAALRGASSMQFVDHTIYPPISSKANTNPVLIIGGGHSVKRHGHAIQRFVENTNATVIHSSLKNIQAHGERKGLIFACLPGHEVEKAPQSIDASIEFIVQAAPRFKGTVPEDLSSRVFQTALFGSVEDTKIGPVSDVGPLALALSAARDLTPGIIYLVGFDGYSNATRAQQDLAQETQGLLNGFTASFPGAQLVSLTPTDYLLTTDSVYRLI